MLSSSKVIVILAKLENLLLNDQMQYLNLQIQFLSDSPFKLYYTNRQSDTIYFLFATMVDHANAISTLNSEVLLLNVIAPMISTVLL